MMSDVHQLEVDGYYKMIRAFFSCNKLNLTNELLLEKLQAVLSISDEQHQQFVELVQNGNDYEASELNKYAPSIKPDQPGSLSHAPSLQAQHSLGRQMGPMGMAPPMLHAPHDLGLYGSLGGPGLVGAAPLALTPVAPAPLPSTAKKSKAGAGGSKASMGPPSSAGPKRPPPIMTPSTTPRANGDYGSGGKKSKAAPTPGTAKSQPKGSGVKSRPGPTARAALAAQAAAVTGNGYHGDAGAGPQPSLLEGNLERLNHREREIFTELIKIGVKDEDPDLNDVHRALLKWYRLDARQQEMLKELEALQVGGSAAGAGVAGAPAGPAGGAAAPGALAPGAAAGGAAPQGGAGVTLIGLDGMEV